MIWLVHLIYRAVGFALCYNYVILNYCIRFAVLPCVRLCLNSCFSVNKKLCAVYNNTIYSYTNTARFVRTNVFVEHYWHIQWEYTNYV